MCYSRKEQQARTRSHINVCSYAPFWEWWGHLRFNLHVLELHHHLIHLQVLQAAQANKITLVCTNNSEQRRDARLIHNRCALLAQWVESVYRLWTAARRVVPPGKATYLIWARRNSKSNIKCSRGSNRSPWTWNQQRARHRQLVVSWVELIPNPEDAHKHILASGRQHTCLHQTPKPTTQRAPHARQHTWCSYDLANHSTAG